MIDLTVIWAAIIGFAIIAYVVMDGFDLGIGILFPLFKVGKDRDTAMNSIAPLRIAASAPSDRKWKQARSTWNAPDT